MAARSSGHSFFSRVRSNDPSNTFKPCSCTLRVAARSAADRTYQKRGRLFVRAVFFVSPPTPPSFGLTGFCCGLVYDLCGPVQDCTHDSMVLMSLLLVSLLLISLLLLMLLLSPGTEKGGGYMPRLRPGTVLFQFSVRNVRGTRRAKLRRGRAFVLRVA